MSVSPARPPRLHGGTLEACALVCYGSGRSIEWRARHTLGGWRYQKMASNGLVAKVAALAGDPGRASMLNALMDERALTATELSKIAGITPQTASGHLSLTIGVGLLNWRKATHLTGIRA